MAAQVRFCPIKIEFYYYSYFYIIFCRKLLPLFVLPKKQRTAGSSHWQARRAAPKRRQVGKAAALPWLPALLLLLSLSCGLPVVVARRRLLDGVIERRTQHASRPQTAAPAAQQPELTGRAAAAAGETQAKCATAAWNLEGATVVVMHTSAAHQGQVA